MSTMSVTKSVTVAASREVAFRVFTEKMVTWWPADHRLGTSVIAAITLEPRVGGRWGERGVDGSECPWGRVLAWDPPNRVVLAWQLDATFVFNPSFETEVEIRFVSEGDKKTRVELEHKHLERYGDKAEMMRAVFDSSGGWVHGLLRFADAVASDGKASFLLRLVPPRPTFAVDKTEAEGRVMQEHLFYWMKQTSENKVVAFGPVADPKGGWGVAIVEVDGDAEVKKLTDEDPAIKHAIGMRYEVLPMPRLILRR